MFRVVINRPKELDDLRLLASSDVFLQRVLDGGSFRAVMPQFHRLIEDRRIDV